MSEIKNFFRATAEDFKKIPGSPIAYWVSDAFSATFASLPKIADLTISDGQTKTGDNDRYLRLLWEVSATNVGKERKWVKHPKGGSFRRWYGNLDTLIDWSEDARVHYRADHVARILPEYLWWRKGFCWTLITSSRQSFRLVNCDEIFNLAAPTLFPKQEEDLFGLLAVVNTKISDYVTKVLNPTINMNVGDVQSIPYVLPPSEITHNVERLVFQSKLDWDSYETSWDFKVNPLVALARGNPVPNTIAALYVTLREKWAADCEEMRRLEIENNRIFIEAYGLQDELTPDVPWNEITLTCNPWYRYGETAPNGGSNEFPIDAELESRLKGDTVKELISYAVGCMMGRYSIDKPGLILADQGATLQDFLTKVPSPSYGVDEDGIIPILDNDWFADDIVTRFKEFVKVVFGEEHFFENMAWIEESLGKDIRSYFTKDFYKDHLQRYQNRPIYWLFQSPKGAFRALVYMHRYKPDMVGGVLGYLRSLQTKIDNQLDVAMQIGMDESKSASERVRANKDAVRFAKAKKELDEYERNVLYPLSTERIEIDLDDGVKVNYRKFGAALRKVDALNKE